MESEARGVPRGYETVRLPTSAILESLVAEAPGDAVTLAWILGRLHERSFGIVLLLAALLGLLPGVATFVGLLLALPAIQMVLLRPEPALPRFLAERRISTERLAGLLGRIVPLLRRLERLVHPRWSPPPASTKLIVGLTVLLLGITLLAPIPFSHYVPILSVILLCVGFLEGDGLLLAVGLLAAMLSIAVIAAAVWSVLAAGAIL